MKYLCSKDKKNPRKILQMAWVQVWFWALSIRRAAVAAGRGWQSSQALENLVAEPGECLGEGERVFELSVAHCVFTLSGTGYCRGVFPSSLLSSHKCPINPHFWFIRWYVFHSQKKEVTPNTLKGFPGTSSFCQTQSCSRSPKSVTLEQGLSCDAQWTWREVSVATF